MLETLKRLCERLAAAQLDCESVMGTYSYARVSREFFVSRQGVNYHSYTRLYLVHVVLQEKERIPA